MNSQHQKDTLKTSVEQGLRSTDLATQDVAVSKSRIWEQICELRKELIALQQARTQIIGFKITIVASGLAVLGSLHEKIPSVLLLLPALAAIFFDFLISNQNVGIKRIGLYIGTQLEPFLKKSGDWPEDVLAWEEFLSRRSMKTSYSLIGNFGFTLLIAFGTSIAFALSSPFYEAVLPILVLILLLTYDMLAFLRPRSVVESETKKR